VRRREFLSACAAAGWSAATPACRRPKTREEVLSALVRELAAPDAAAVAPTSEELQRAIAGFTSAPDLEGLRRARRHWHAALLAWKRVECFRAAPVVENHALSRAVFWPARAAAIEPILAASTALDAAYLDELAVNARGVYTLEYLLFPLDVDERAALALFTGAAAERRRSYTLGLARNLTRYAELAASSLADGAFATRFGADGQKSLGQLVTQLVTTVEKLSAQRLDLVLRLETSGRLKPNEIEGWPSATSHQIVATQFATCQLLYEGAAGGGIVDLAGNAAPPVAERVRNQFRTARAAVEALDGPLERLVRTRRAALELAARTTRTLEIMMKAELTSALGLTLTFPSTDGD
jgi:uncharacterized protein